MFSSRSIREASTLLESLRRPSSTVWSWSASPRDGSGYGKMRASDTTPPKAAFMNDSSSGPPEPGRNGEDEDIPRLSHGGVAEAHARLLRGSQEAPTSEDSD